MISFEQYLDESIVDIPKNSMAPDVFSFEENREPILLDSIRYQILNDIQKFKQISNVKGAFIVGSILTKLYNKTSDIDVNIEMYNEEVDDMSEAKLLLLLKNINGRMATGTQHPINYYILLKEPSEDQFNGIYDIFTNKLIKVPKELEFNINNYFNKFDTEVSKLDIIAAKLRRDIIDYTELSSMSIKDIKNLKELLQSKIFDISRNIETIIDIKQSLKKTRKIAFSKPMTPDEIETYANKQKLPANVIYKLIQKYYYWDFIEKLQKIIEDSENIKPSDIENIKKAGDEFYTKENFELLDEKIRPISLKSIPWGNTRKLSHLYKQRNDMNRKKLSQIPDTQRAMGDKNHRNLIGAMNSAKRLVDIAKKTPSGLWRLMPSQVRWLAMKYHHISPDKNSPIKHLGNTGIIVWRKDKNKYYLVKTGRKQKRY